MIDEAFFDTQFGINVRGAYFVMKHAIEIMPDGGSIILTSSVSGALGGAGQTVYGARKAAVRSFGRTFARELAPRNIGVNTISPRSDRYTRSRQGRNAARTNREHSPTDRTARESGPSSRGRLGGAVPSF